MTRIKRGDLVSVTDLDGFWVVTDVLARAADGIAILIIHRDGVRRTRLASRATLLRAPDPGVKGWDY